MFRGGLGAVQGVCRVCAGGIQGLYRGCTGGEWRGPASSALLHCLLVILPFPVGSNTENTVTSSSSLNSTTGVPVAFSCGAQGRFGFRI